MSRSAELQMLLENTAHAFHDLQKYMQTLFWGWGFELHREKVKGKEFPELEKTYNGICDTLDDLKVRIEAAV